MQNRTSIVLLMTFYDSKNLRYYCKCKKVIVEKGTYEELIALKNWQCSVTMQSLSKTTITMSRKKMTS
jgi:hypothetical protein